MKNHIIFKFILFLFMGYTFSYSNYLDVGSIPENIKITLINEIQVPSGCTFKSWSPDGNFFAFSRRDEFNSNSSNSTRMDKSIIFYNNGNVYKKIDGSILFWSNDSKEVFLIKGRTKYLKFNFYTNISQNVQVDLENSHSLYNEEFFHGFNPTNGNLFYHKKNTLYEYNFTSKTSTLIFTFPGNNIDNATMINADSILVTLIDSNDKSFVYKLNMSKKSYKKFFPENISDIKIDSIRNNKYLVLIDSGLSTYLYCLDLNGNYLLKLKGRPFSTPDDWNDICIQLDLSSFAPNGKILSTTIGEVHEDEIVGESGRLLFKSGDIYLIGMNGKLVNVSNTKDKIEMVLGWSPQGDKLIYYEQIDKKYYLSKISLSQQKN